MKLFHHIGRALRTGRTLSLHTHAYWGYCPHCMEATPWFTNTWTGEYRCTRCDHDQLRDATN